MTDQETSQKNQDQSYPNKQYPNLSGVFDLLKPSWSAVKLNLITLIEFIVIPIILSLLSVVFWKLPSHSLFTGLSTIAGLLIGPGMIYTLLEGANGKSIDFYPAFRKGLTFFWCYLGVTILSAILIIGGLILLIIPGIYMLRRYYLAQYYLIDRNLGVLETMRVSKEESMKFTGPILQVFCVQLLFAAIIVIPPLGTVAGIILSIMFYNAPAIRYEQIKHVLGVKPTKKTQQASSVS